MLGVAAWNGSSHSLLGTGRLAQATLPHHESRSAKGQALFKPLVMSCLLTFLWTKSRGGEVQFTHGDHQGDE